MNTSGVCARGASSACCLPHTIYPILLYYPAHGACVSSISMLSMSHYAVQAPPYRCRLMWLVSAGPAAKHFLSPTSHAQQQREREKPMGTSNRRCLYSSFLINTQTKKCVYGGSGKRALNKMIWRGKDRKWDTKVGKKTRRKKLTKQMIGFYNI